MNDPEHDCARRLFRRLMIALVGIAAAAELHAQTLASVSPAAQRVHEYIELEGSGFGTSQGASNVRFTDGTNTWDAPKAYVWRDNYIRVRVPVGNRIGGAPLPIAKTPLEVFVQTPSGMSAARAFQVISVESGSLGYRELTDIESDQDTSSVLGSPNLNYARSKDSDLADVNGDGFMDILDNNSSNVQNDAHGVIRINNQDKTFTAIRLEQRDAGDTGVFATTPTGGDFLEDETSYDADMFDANGDRLPDIFQTASKNPPPADGSNARIRILMNDPASPGSFSEETTARLPLGALGTVGCPDDLDHADIDNDGNLDFLVTMRTAPPHCAPGEASVTQVFVNRGGGTYDTPITLDAPAGISTHDAFFIDVDNDGFEDVVVCNEFPFATSFSQIFLHDGSDSASPYTPGEMLSVGFDAGDSEFVSADASTGVAADFNGDGFEDFALAHSDVFVFLNDPDDPGDFQNIPDAPGFDAARPANPALLPPPAGGNPFYYDLEAGDVDLDGDVDIVGASLRADADDNVQIWLNNGDGTFVNVTSSSATDLLPNNEAYQRLTADMLDFDLDGDLDLYIAGADGTGVGPDPGFGKVPNQFYENLLIGLNIVYPLQAQPAFAGSATGGRKVLVRLRANTPVAGLTPADFLINVDGADLDPSATVTGAQIEEEYWLLVQMPAKPDGCYALNVSLTGDAALSDREPMSLCYDEERQFDRSLAIDRTNSMLRDSVTGESSNEKMESAQAAAGFFVNLSEDDDRIGVSSFQRDSDDGDGVVEQSELAQQPFGMVEAFDDASMTDNRTLAVAAVGGIWPGGPGFPQETSIGAGMVRAWEELEAQGDADHEWEIVVLSDGLENFPPFWSEVAAGPPLVLPLKPDILAADPPVTVHTIAIGRDADAPLLMEIARDTGGVFFNLYEGTASYGLMSRLSSVYKYIDEEMRDEQRFFYREGVPDPVPFAASPFGAGAASATTHKPGMIRYASFHVPQGFESISVGFHWNVDNAIEQVLLTGPDLSPIAPSPPVRTIHTNPKHKIYRVRDPEPGWYHYVVAVGTGDPFEFFAVASGITDLLAVGRVGRIDEATPGTYEIPLRLVVGDDEPILHAGVSGEVILPDKSRVPITLHDDGAHGDGGGLDGIYGQTFVHDMPGGYMAELTTTGISSRNEPFTRLSYLSFALPGGVPGADHPEVPPDKGGDCIPCEWLRILLALFGLLILVLFWLWYRCCYRRAVTGVATVGAVARRE